MADIDVESEKGEICFNADCFLIEEFY